MSQPRLVQFHSSTWETSMPVYSKVQRRSPQVSQPRLVQFQFGDIVPDYSKVQRRSPQVSQPRLVQFHSSTWETSMPVYSKVQRSSPPSVTAETRPVPVGRRRASRQQSAEKKPTVGRRLPFHPRSRCGRVYLRRKSTDEKRMMDVLRHVGRDLPITP